MNSYAQRRSKNNPRPPVLQANQQNTDRNRNHAIQNKTENYDTLLKQLLGNPEVSEEKVDNGTNHDGEFQHFQDQSASDL